LYPDLFTYTQKNKTVYETKYHCGFNAGIVAFGRDQFTCKCPGMEMAQMGRLRLLLMQKGYCRHEQARSRLPLLQPVLLPPWLGLGLGMARQVLRGLLL